MMVSTKGRYGLRVMIDLAEHRNGDYVVLMDIARRQGLSEKYLEGILSVLSRNGFVLALRGRGGGYQLAKAPGEYTIGSILRALEGPLVPVACLGDSCEPCAHAAECRTLPFWTKLGEHIDAFLDNVTLADLLEGGALTETEV